MGGRKEGAGFEAINGLQLGFLEVNYGGSGLGDGEPDIVALVFVSRHSNIPREDGDCSSHKRTKEPPIPVKRSMDGWDKEQANNKT
jgi:hypothetical protein